MIMELLAGASSLANAFGQQQDDKRDARNYNRVLDAQTRELNKQRNQLGIDAKQAQDWATLQIAKSQNNPNVMSNLSNVYSNQINNISSRDADLASKVIETQNKKINIPKTNPWTMVANTVAGGLAGHYLTGGSTQGVDGAVSGLLKKGLAAFNQVKAPELNFDVETKSDTSPDETPNIDPNISFTPPTYIHPPSAPSYTSNRVSHYVEPLMLRPAINVVRPTTIPSSAYYGSEPYSFSDNILTQQSRSEYGSSVFGGMTKPANKPPLLDGNFINSLFGIKNNKYNLNPFN